MIREHLVRHAAALVASCIFAGAVHAGAAGTIVGRLTDAITGAPIVGAQVNVHGPGGQGFAMPTGADGRYASPALPPGSWRVRTLAPDHLDELFDGLPCENGFCDVDGGTPVAVTAGNAAVADFALVPGASIAGRITGPGGAPVAMTNVIVLRVTGELAAQVVTDADGHYQTPRDLAAGNYRVYTLNPYSLIDEVYPDVACPGGTGCDTQLGGAITVAAGSTVAGIDLQLAAGARLSGRITAAASGAAAAGAVFAYRDNALVPVVSLADVDGRWRSPALPAGGWRLAVGRQGSLLGEMWPNIACDIDCQPPGGMPVQLGASDVTDVDFTLDSGSSLTGTITAANGGAPVGNAMVLVHDAVRGIVSVVFTAPDGTYATEAFLSGTVTLSAQAPNFLPAAYGEPCEPACGPGSGALVSPPLGVSGGYDFALQAGGGLKGLVTGPNGPMAGVQVLVMRSEGGLAQLAYTGADGRYDTGTSLGSGDYRVRTSNYQGAIDEAWPGIPCVGGACGLSVGDLVSITLGQTSSADFDLAAGARIGGQVRRAADGAPVGAAVLRLTDASGLYLSFLADGNGDFDTATGLPPGNYYLMASSPGSELLPEAWQEQPCLNCLPVTGTPIPVIGTGRVSGIDFTLEPGAVVTGQVTDAVTGQPVANADVWVFDAQAQEVIASGFTGNDGRYRTSAFVPADVRLLANAGGYIAAIPGAAACDGACDPEESALLQAGTGETGGVDFALRRGSRIAGRVLEPAGTPVQNVWVSAASADFGQQALTDADGRYAIDGLPDGRFFVYAQGVGEYVATAWPGEQCVTDCDQTTRETIALASGDDIGGIDITLIAGGHLRGRVEGMPGNLPQPGIVAFFERQSLQQVGVSTLVDGEYRSDPLPPGEYFLYTGTTGGYIDELHADVPCPYTCSETLGTPVAVTSANDSVVDFQLARGGRIAGRIFDAGTNGALPARPTVQVRAADYSLVWSGMVATNGTYTTAALPPGTYYVRSRNRNGFLDEFYLDEECYWCLPVGGIDQNGQPATPIGVGVTIGAITGGIDLGLVPGRRLSGRVTREPDGGAVRQMLVSVYDANGRFMSSATTDNSGAWLLINGVPAGTYYLRTTNDGHYLDELFGGARCLGNCDVTQGVPVVVANADRGDLDFQLQVQPQMFGNGFE